MTGPKPSFQTADRKRAVARWVCVFASTGLVLAFPVARSIYLVHRRRHQ